MNFFTTGIKEVTRRLRRQKNRLALASSRKALEEAETALGRHGWRELAAPGESENANANADAAAAVNDDTDAATREALSTLRLLEGELASNAAHVAELKQKIHAHEEEREQARRDCEAALAKIDEERRPVQEAADALETRITDARESLRDYDKKSAELDSEQLHLLREHAQLHVDAELEAAGTGEPDASRAREMRRREISGRRSTIPDQLAGVQKSRAAAAAPIPELEAELRKARTQLLDFERRVRETRAALAGREKAITAEIASCNRDIAVSRRQAARVEEQKEESYRLAGQRLADQPAPPAGENGEEFFEEVQRRRQAARSLAELEATWARESQEANQQDLRIFRFVGVTCAVLLALSLLLVFRSPPKRDYLPANTETIVSLNVSRFADADFSRALQQQSPDVWKQLWADLVRKVGEVPEIDLSRQVARVTHAMAPGGNHQTVDYLLVEMRSPGAVDAVTRQLSRKGSAYSYHYINGLNYYEREPDLAVARLGPTTLALGTAAAVEELINVRLGLRPDLKVDTQFLNEFNQLDEGSALRLITLRPARLNTLAEPLLTAELLNNCELLGMAIDLHPQKPVSAMLLLQAGDLAAASQLAGLLRASPEQVLQLQSAGPNLFIEQPVVSQNEREVRWQFRMTSPAAREFLQRVSRLGLAGRAPAVAAAAEESGSLQTPPAAGIVFHHGVLREDRSGPAR